MVTAVTAIGRILKRGPITQSRRSPNDFDRQEPANSGHSAKESLTERSFDGEHAKIIPAFDSKDIL